MDVNQTGSAGADVTIEAASPNQTGSRELARGILLSEEVVMVPDPPVELLRKSSTLIAIITHVSASGSSTEAIPVAGSTSLRLSSADLGSACAMLRLASPAHNVPAGPRHSIPELVEALRIHQGNLWEVMSPAGRTSVPGQQEGTTTAEMDEGDGPWDYEENSANDYFIGICRVCKCCGP